MRKSPKIVSIVGFLLSLPSLSATLLPSLSVSQSIPASFHFNWDGNFLRTKRIPRNQREPNGERARSVDGAPRKPTKKNQQRRQWANGSIGVSEICANNYEAWEPGGGRGNPDLADCRSAWHFSLAFFAQCVSVCLSDFSSIRMSSNELRMCEDTFFGCPLEEPRTEPRTISGSSN